MSFFTPPGPLIPGSINLSSMSSNSTNIGSITNQSDVNIKTQNGLLKLSIGNSTYIWPSSSPPGYNYVLGIDNIETVGETTIYTLGWVIGFICYHVSTKVMLENGAVVRMDELKYGDLVMALDDKMKIIYSPVVDFTGYFPESNGSFVKIYCENYSLIVSGIHLIMSENYYKMAKDLEVGMNILCYNNEINFSKITEIEYGTDKGWITPLTETGTIVAEGMITSCHTGYGVHGSKYLHEISRIFYKPFQWYLTFFPRKKGEKPTEKFHWYSQGFRRSFVGECIIKILCYIL